MSKLEKGNLSKVQFNPNISRYIDKKNLNKFIGRKTDLENIIRKILEIKYEDKVLTIKGAGGIGKTLTTTKAAYELSQRGYFEKGLFFIACDAVNTIENFTYEISTSFDLTSSNELIRQIRDNHIYKNRLIILDNFETILYSDDRDQIINLVSNICEYATVLITSRQVLRLNFEEVYELRNFTTDEGVELFKSIYKHIAPQEESILRREIVEKLLNNNPLAIKLISKGLVSHKNILTLQKELEADIFKFGNIELIFEGNEDINIEKSHSLYHSVNYSYQKLTEKEKIAFELLSLFPDGIHLENFKLFSKTLIGKSIIEDKDIKELDNKSLLENSNGRLKLQSIINRFAEHQFQKRDDSYKLSCYENIFGYNSYFADLYSNRILRNTSRALKIQDANMNNYLKSLSTFPLLNISVERKLNYIDDINEVFLHTNQPRNFLRELENIENSFKENEKAYKYIQLVKSYTIYWTKDFGSSSAWIYKNYPIENLDFILDKDFLDIISSYILRSFYFCEGDSFSVLKSKIKSTKHQSFIGDNLFELGYFSGAQAIYKIEHYEDFFFWELQVATNNLSLIDIDKYLKSLYKKDTLDLIQVTYTKQKLFEVPNSEIKKFPISNPYSQGLIYLMLANNEINQKEKRNLFLKSIDKLANIKYYYCESIYYFSTFLFENNDEDFDYWHSKGKAIAVEKKFNYLVYRFDQIKNTNHFPYDENERIPKELTEEIDQYLEGYKIYVQKLNSESSSKIRK